MKSFKNGILATAFGVAVCVGAPTIFVIGQGETPPAPSSPKTVSIPAVKERTLGNGLTVAVVERRTVPIVTVQLLVKSGASAESSDKAGLANLAASMLTKGTRTRTATQIAEEIEFLGGSISNGAGWNNSTVSVTVASDKLERAMAILADVVLNPQFDQKELDLLKSQTLDGLTYNLKQPGYLANYVASKYSFDEHPAGGTPESLKTISRSDISQFHRNNFKLGDSVLIFAGDVSAITANKLASKYFGIGKKLSKRDTKITRGSTNAAPETLPLLKRILVIDSPAAGQASVNYATTVSSGRVLPNIGTRSVDAYFEASVLNSVLGGGYSSRLNQEIRIKRGLSYGAGSSFAWRNLYSNFATRTQTKNESAAEVAELVLIEVKRLAEDEIGANELVPRKSVLTGTFGRNSETTVGLAGAAADLYSFDIPVSELNNYFKNVNSVTNAQIRQFASSNLRGGDIIIVGDYSKFKDDLSKRFPKTTVDVVRADQLDLSKKDIRK